MALQLGFDLIRETFTQTTIFGVNWILALLATVIILVLINGRNWSGYKATLLPATICIHILGLTPSILQYTIGALLMVIETMSLEMLGNIAETTTNLGRRTVESVGMISSRIYDRDTYKEVRQKPTDIMKKGYLDRLEAMTKKKLTVGFDKEGKAITKDIIDEDALEKARKQGYRGTGFGALGASLRADKRLTEDQQMAYNQLRDMSFDEKRRIKALETMERLQGMDVGYVKKRQKELSSIIQRPESFMNLKEDINKNRLNTLRKKFRKKELNEIRRLQIEEELKKINSKLKKKLR